MSVDRGSGITRALRSGGPGSEAIACSSLNQDQKSLIGPKSDPASAEGPAEHIRNALQILRFASRVSFRPPRRDWLLTSLAKEAIERRLNHSLQQLEPRVTGRCEITDAGRNALSVSSIDDMIEIRGGA